MEIEINGIKKSLKELTYLDAVEIQETVQKEGIRAGTKKLLTLQGLTDEEAEKLNISEGVKIQNKLAEITKDFQTPVVESKAN